MFEGFEIPSSKIFHQATAKQGSKEDDEWVFFEFLEEDGNAESAKTIDRQPRAMQNAAINEFAGINKEKNNFPEPANKGASHKDEKIVHYEILNGFMVGFGGGCRLGCGCHGAYALIIADFGRSYRECI